MSCPASGPYCSVKTVTSSCEAPGTSRFATCTGCAGSRASSTATPPDGQNCGCDESKKPQRPTYANLLCTNTSPLNPRSLRLFWPTEIMFSDDPLLVPLLLLPDESRKCCSFGNSSSFEAAPANADTASASATPSTIRVLRMVPPFLVCGSWMPSSAVTTLSAERELLRLRVEVAELERAADGGVAQVPDQQAAGDVGLVDAAVVPVARPVAAELEHVRVEWRWIGVGDLAGVRRVGEVDDGDAGLVVTADEHAPALRGHDVVVVDRAVLGQRLVARQRPLAEERAVSRREEEERLHLVGLHGAVGEHRAGRHAAWLAAAARLAAKDQHFAVPGEGDGVASGRAGDVDREELLRVFQRAAARPADAPDGEAGLAGDRAGAGGEHRVAEDDGAVVAAPAGGLEAQVVRRRGIVERDLDDVEARAGAAGRVVVDQEPVVREIRHCGLGVRAAERLDRSDQVGVERVRHVEDVKSFPAVRIERRGRDGLPVARCPSGGG